MKLKIVYQYLLVGLATVGVFATLLWNRTDVLLKNFIVDKSYQILHSKNISKVHEIDSKINFYLLSSRDIYKKLLSMKFGGQTFSVDQEIDPDIVGADLYTFKEGRYELYSAYAKETFFKSHQLSEDFIKENVGHSPLNLNSLLYGKYLIQKLHAPNSRSDLLAIGLNVSAIDLSNSRPYILVLYIDALRFNSLFEYKRDDTQFIFESLGGVISGYGDIFKDSISRYPPLRQLGENDLSVLKSNYIDPETGRTNYFSIMKSTFGYYIVTEVPESELLKPLNILKSNYSMICGIALSLMVFLYLVMSLVTMEKNRILRKQLEAFSDYQMIRMKFGFKFFTDEFDDLLFFIQSALAKSLAALDHVLMTKKFSHSPVSSQVQHKVLSLRGAVAQSLIMKLVFENPSDIEIFADIDKYLSTRENVLKKITGLVHDQGGVILSCDTDSLTVSFGVFCEDLRYQIKGLACALEISELLKVQWTAQNNSLNFNIFISSGKVLAHESNLTGVNEFFLVGGPALALQKMSQWRDLFTQSILVTTEIVDLGSKYFKFTGLLDKQAQDQTKLFRCKSEDLDLYQLLRQTTENKSAA